MSKIRKFFSVVCFFLLSTCVLNHSVYAAETKEQENPIVQYVYVDSPNLVTPDIQKIAVSFQERIQADNITLVYENEKTKEQYITNAKVENTMAIFSIEYPENSTAGIYHLLKMQIQHTDNISEIYFEDIGIDSTFGVNQMCETNADAIIVEDNNSKFEKNIESENKTNIITYGNNGLIQGDSIPEAIKEIPQYNTKAKNIEDKSRQDNLVIVLDPGHGGTDSGAVGVHGVYEKNITLKIAQYCKKELEKYNNVNVYLTRTEDVCVGGATNARDDLINRVKYASEKNASALISIHLNSSGVGYIRGAEIYYPNLNYNPAIGNAGKNIAQKIQNELVNLGLANRGIKIRNTENGSKYPDGSASDYYSLIWRSKEVGIPAIIIEHAFIDNINDYNEFFSSEEKIRNLGIADAKGIAEAYGLNFKEGNWVQSGNRWWYQNSDGSYATGWKQIEGIWYYFDESGWMVTGWKWLGSVCYYFCPNGAMATDTWIDGYYVDSTGVWIPEKQSYQEGWIQSGNRWWYQNSDGSYATGWKQIEGIWYYFDESGWMVTGWKWLGSVCYYFCPNGAMATDTWIDGYYVDSTGVWIPEKQSYQEGWIQSGDRWWYQNSDGSYATGWKQIEGIWYYFDESGWMVTGWKWLGSVCYYFYPNGAMATDTWIDGYYVDMNGVWIVS